MASPRDTCPNCGNQSITAIEVVSLAGWVDYFRCPTCRAVWNVPKHQDGPVQTVVEPLKITHATP